MRKLIKYTVSLLVITLVSCNDMLDIDPIDSVDDKKAIKTSADVEGLLVGAYDGLSDGDLLGGNLQRDAELLGDDGEISWVGTFVAPGEIHAKSMLITNDQAQNTWLDAYETINTCNLVLANLSLVTEDRRDRVEGEAKFIRGLLYFELVRLYAKAWNDGFPISNPGVPLVTSPTNAQNAGQKIPRSTVSEVYAQVLNDLTDAETLLPETNGFFATTYAASAILSRVHLMQGSYGLAVESASRVIESGLYALTPNFSDAFNKSSTQIIDRERNANATSEDIFSIQLTTQDGTNNLNTFMASADFAGRGDVILTYSDDIEDWPHLLLYESDDERLGVFYDDGSDFFTAKFNNQFGNVPVVRLGELYLTRAEANFREGTSVGASPLEDVNTIRERSGLADLSSVDLDAILMERRLELAFEGHKLHDYKRTQRDLGTIAWNAPQLIFPIPQRERLINPNLQQNEFYVSGN
jgi:starch-binding outer membrane protein, SusD/RagB family